MPEQMSLENYKKKVEKCLLATMNSKTAIRLMQRDEKELKECYEESWSPEGTAAGIASGLL